MIACVNAVQHIDVGSAPKLLLNRGGSPPSGVGLVIMKHPKIAAG